MTKELRQFLKDPANTKQVHAKDSDKGKKLHKLLQQINEAKAVLRAKRASIKVDDEFHAEFGLTHPYAT